MMLTRKRKKLETQISEKRKELEDQLCEKQKKMEEQRWAMRGDSSDSEQSETEIPKKCCICITPSPIGPEITEFPLVPSKLSFQPEKLNTFVRRKTKLSEQCQQAQAKTDGLNPCDKEAEGFGGDPVGAKSASVVLGSEKGVEESTEAGVRHEVVKSASATESQKEDSTVAVAGNGVKLKGGFNSASDVSQSDKELEAKESSQYLVETTAKSASAVLALDQQEAEETNEDFIMTESEHVSARHEGVKSNSALSEAEESSEDLVMTESEQAYARPKGVKSASAVSLSHQEEAKESDEDTESEQAGARDKRAKSVSESESEEEDEAKSVSESESEEEDEDCDRHKGKKIAPSKGCAKRRAVHTSENSASTVSESDSDKGEESDEDSDRHRGVKIVPSKRCAKRRAVDISDRMKRFREAEAKIDRMNPEASRPPHRSFNKSFLTQKNCSRYKSYWKKEMVEQRLVDLDSYPARLGIKQILKDNNLLNTVTCVEPYVREIVMEFYANLPSNETNKLVQKVFVRGQMFEFSPKLIDSVLGLRGTEITRVKENSIDVDLDLIAATLTNGNVKDWEKITPAYLAPKIAALHIICCANWIPTGNAGAEVSEGRAKLLYMLLEKTPFNFGKLVYDQIIRLGKKAEYRFKPVFPALIFQVLNYQRSIPLFKGESFSHLATPISYHVRLNRGKHVSPPSPSGPKGQNSKKASLPSLSGPKDKTQGRSSKNVSPPSPSARNSKKASLLSHSGPKSKARGRNIKNAGLHLTPRRKLKLKLKAYIDKAMAYLKIPNIDKAMTYLEVANGEIDTSSDEEETDDMMMV